MSKLLVTGSSGLIGSEVVDYFCKLGWEVHGVDNNMRADFFGLGTRISTITNSISATGLAWTHSWKRFGLCLLSTQPPNPAMIWLPPGLSMTST